MSKMILVTNIMTRIVIVRKDNDQDNISSQDNDQDRRT